MRGAQRTPEQIRQHYEIEKELAARLRDASKEERHSLYSSLYDEMFRRVPSHPQLTRRVSPAQTRREVDRQMRFLKRFLSADSTFLEVGPGDCALAREVARHVERVYAVDVSDEISSAENTPGNFELILSDGCSVPVPAGTVDIAYSNQLMEHLHPDDALEQLAGVFDALALGGRYVCVTPNRLTGPHDVSRYFDDTATCFHLREYTVTELSDLFAQVGFSKVRLYVGAKGLYSQVPATLLLAFERWLDGLPDERRRSVVRNAAVSLPLNGVRLVATK